MNPLKLLYPSYLFDTLPGQQFAYLWVCIAFFSLLVALGQYLRIYISKSPNKKILKKLLHNVTGRLNWIAFTGLLFVYFRHENLPFLAMRVWIVAIMIGTLVYIWKIWEKFNKVLPTELNKGDKKDDSLKYMPKAKKKKRKKRR